MTYSTLPIITSATAAIRAIIGTTWSGTAMSGTRRRAILAMCTARSPMRSNSLTIRSDATSIRRSPATGFCRESSSKLSSSSFSRRRRSGCVVADHLLGLLGIALEQGGSALGDGFTDESGHRHELVADRVELVGIGVAHEGQPTECR